MRPAEHIRSIAESVIESAGCFLLDVVPETGQETVYWILVDAEQAPVSLETCGLLSREIGFLLDAHDELKGRYRLNVSSPGLDRPLSDRRQYPKNVGRHIRVSLRDGSAVEGELRSVDSQGLDVKAAGGVRTIRFDQIKESIIIPRINKPISPSPQHTVSGKKDAN